MAFLLQQVAIICNHQRTISKSHSAQMSRLTEKIEELKVITLTWKFSMLVSLTFNSWICTGDRLVLCMHQPCAYVSCLESCCFFWKWRDSYHVLFRTLSFLSWGLHSCFIRLHAQIPVSVCIDDTLFIS